MSSSPPSQHHLGVLDNSDEWLQSISQFKESLCTIKAALGKHMPGEPSNTGFFPGREDLMGLWQSVERVQEPLQELETFAIRFLDSARQAGIRGRSADLDNPHDVNDQWSLMSPTSDRSALPMEQLNRVDKDKRVPTLEVLIQTCVSVYNQLERDDDFQRAKDVRRVTEELQELNYQTERMTPEIFTSVDIEEVTRAETRKTPRTR